MTEAKVPYTTSRKTREADADPDIVVCKTPAPCGRECVLDGAYKHEFCCCDKRRCEHCHGAQRFQRVRR